jgi:hypothetical protein
MPPCTSTHVTFALTWKINWRYYVGFSHNFRPGALVTFAASIRKF